MRWYQLRLFLVAEGEMLETNKWDGSLRGGLCEGIHDVWLWMGAGVFGIRFRLLSCELTTSCKNLHLLEVSKVSIVFGNSDLFTVQASQSYLVDIAAMKPFWLVSLVHTQTCVFFSCQSCFTVMCEINAHVKVSAHILLLIITSGDYLNCVRSWKGGLFVFAAWSEFAHSKEGGIIET